MQTISITEAERNTIIAALRYFQYTEPDCLGDHIDDIATNGQTDAALSTDEIDALCEKINA